MNSSLLRVVIALFLIAHGLMHYSLSTVPLPEPGSIKTPFWPSWRRPAADPNWLASRMGLPVPAVRTAGWLLWMAATVCFILAGLGLLGLPGLAAAWPMLAVAGAVFSLLVHAFYFHPWLVMGLVIEVAVLAVVYFRWPVFLFPAR